MKRHLLGLGIFISIVGTAIFIGNLFASRWDCSLRMFEKRTPIESRTYCNLRRKNPLSISQAVFDKKTKSLELKFTKNSEAVYRENFPVNLYIFSKDGDRTHFVSTEQIQFNSLFASENEIFVKLYGRLNEIGNQENLYLMTDLYVFKDANKSAPDFDAETAVPVLSER